MIYELHQQTLRTRRHGFTLIQAFVSVAALVALFMLAFVFAPIFSHGEPPSRRSICQSNLKQIGLGIMQYLQDYDQQYPRLATFDSSGSIGPNSTVSWRQALDPYIKSKLVYQCPGNPIRESVSPVDGYFQSYDVADCGPIRLSQAIKPDDIPDLSTAFLVFEENGDTPQARQTGVLWDHDPGEPGWTNILFAGHLTQSNYLYGDGHVKSLRPMLTVRNGINSWHLHNTDPVSPRVLAKLRAAQQNFGP